MAPSDIKAMTRDADYVGINIARTIRVYSRLLYDWCEYEIVGENEKPRRRGYLKSIYLDKLAEFYCRLWDRLCDEHKVRFVTPFDSERGFHGPGRAFKINRKEAEKRLLRTDKDNQRHNDKAYTTEILEKLKPPFSGACMLFSCDPINPWDSECRFYPQLAMNLWESWLSRAFPEDERRVFLTPGELGYVEMISDMLKPLSREQLRAIGTHQNKNETFLDIEYNVKHWERNYKYIKAFLESGADLSKIRSKDNIEKAAYILVTTSGEMLRKSKENRDHYESGYKSIINNPAASRELVANFMSVQDTADRIWDNDLNSFSAFAAGLYDLSVYCRRGLMELGLGHKLKDWEIELSGECASRLSNTYPLLAPFGSIKTIGKRSWLQQLQELLSGLFQFEGFMIYRRIIKDLTISQRELDFFGE
jgi:hypothetical protein